MTPLPFRNALHDDDSVVSVLHYEGAVTARPVVTIAIPTFNRPVLIQETLTSALDQTTDIPLEILIIDNASEPINVEKLLNYIKSLHKFPVRYFVNEANIGMFGNWNRCISLAKGDWITILSDDDLLLPNHLTRIFQSISVCGDQRASYTCGYTFLDQRAVKARSSLTTSVFLKARKTLRFMGRRLIRLGPKRMFWSNIAGSSLGAVFPRALAIEIGGFYPEDFPSADYYFHTRVSLKGRLYQIADDLVRMRLQVNETMKPATLLGFIVSNHRLRLGLAAAGAVPRYWAKLSPVLIAYERRASLRFAGVDLTKAEVTAATGEQERYIPSALVWLWRALCGGL